MPKPSLCLDCLIRGAVTLAVALTALSILDPALASANQQFEVTGLRVGIHSDKTRVVLDVSGDVPFLVTLVGDGDTVIVEIPGVSWKPNTHRLIGKGLIRDYEYEVNNGSSILVLTTKGPVLVEKSFTLSPSSSGGHRIVIDLVSTGDYPETRTDETVVGTVDRKQMPTVNDKLLVVAGTDKETMSVSVTENAQYNPRHFQTAQYDRSPISGDESPRPRRSPFEIMGGSDIYPSPLDRRFYIAARVGASFLMDSTNKGQLLTLEATPDRAGFIGGGAVGFNLGSGFLLEGEVTYTKSNLKFLEITDIGSITGINIGTSSVDGNVTALSFMANGAYEFRNQSGLTPYLKVGIGVSSISANDVEIAGIKIVDDDDLVFAYQLGAGLNFALDERTSLDFAYRYFATSDPALTDAAGDEFDSEYSSHNFLLGLRYSF